MGSLQIVYYILGLAIITGIVVAGYEYFKEFTQENNRSELISYIQALQRTAKEYQKTPKKLNGGEGSFLGWEPTMKLKFEDVGKIRYKTFENGINFLGTGRIDGLDGENSVQILVKYRNPNNSIVKIIN